MHSGAVKKQWNASPAVAKLTELFSEGKANGEVKQPPTLRSLVDSAGRASVCNSKTDQEKATGVWRSNQVRFANIC